MNSYTLDLILRIGVQMLLLVCSAFFSSSETALFSLTKNQLRQIEREKNPKSPALHALLEKPRKLIISILCGNELVNVAASANMVAILLLTMSQEQAGVFNLIIMVPVLLLFGEVTPKTIALYNPAKYSLKVVVSPLSFWIKWASPLIWVVRNISERITNAIVGAEKSADNILHLDEFRAFIENVAKEGQITPSSNLLLDRILSAGTAEVTEVMIPRTQVTFLNAANPVPDLVEQFLSLKTFRVPVYRISRDNLLGFIHLEDIIDIGVEVANAKPIEELVRPPMIIPQTKTVDETLDYFQSNKLRTVAVVDEFGAIDGFVHLENILGYLFGHDAAATKARLNRGIQISKDSFKVPGDMKLVDFNDLTNFDVTDEKMVTIAGVVLRHLNKQPLLGDVIVLSDIELKITQMEGIRISEVEARRIVNT